MINPHGAEVSILVKRNIKKNWRCPRCQRLLINDLEIVALTIDFDDGVLYNLCYSLAGLRQLDIFCNKRLNKSQRQTALIHRVMTVQCTEINNELEEN